MEEEINIESNKHERALKVGSVATLLIELGLTEQEAKDKMVEILKEIDNKNQN